MPLAKCVSRSTLHKIIEVTWSYINKESDPDGHGRKVVEVYYYQKWKDVDSFFQDLDLTLHIQEADIYPCYTEIEVKCREKFISDKKFHQIFK